MSEIDRLNSITPQVRIGNERTNSKVKQDKNFSKKKEKKKKKRDGDDDHELDEYA